MVGWMQADFAERGIDSPRLDAELLVAHVLGVPRLQLYLDLDRPINATELTSLRELVRRRREREPVAYLVGFKDFWRGRFRVDSRVLVPRPDTETLVERAVALLRGDVRPEGDTHFETIVDVPAEDVPDPDTGADEGQESELEIEEERGEELAELEDASTFVEPTDAEVTRIIESAEPAGPAVSDSKASTMPRFARARPDATTVSRSALPEGPVVDLCTGSGCVVISLACEVPDRTYLATDLSAGAIEIATQNASTAETSVTFVVGDLFAGQPGPFALIVANPPYVEDAEIARLEPEVARHEPRLALAGGADGLDVFRRLVSEAFERLASGGALLVEIGSDQGPRAAEIVRRAGFSDVRVLPDLAGRDRVVEGWRR